MNQKKSVIVEFFKNKGFYAVLVVCVIAAAVSSYLAIETLVEQFTTETPITFDGAAIDDFGEGLGVDQEAANPEENVPIEEETAIVNEPAEEIIEEVIQPVTEQIPVEVETVPTEAEPIPAPPAVPAEPINFTMPVNGEIIQQFSGDELVFNETMGDWRTHNGVDVAAAIDTPVVAIQAGTVSKVSIDDLLGGVVEIQSGEVLIRYCGLNNEISLQKGQELRCGDVIGRVGEMPSELSLPSHIHIEAMRGEEYFSFTDLE